jgi:hypothetical protein
MEVELIYNTEKINQTISPLKTIIYIKQIASTSFSIPPNMLGLYYNGILIQKKSDNIQLKDYFHKEKNISLIVKREENSTTTTNSHTTKESMKIGKLKLNLNNLNKKVSLLPHNEKTIVNNSNSNININNKNSNNVNNKENNSNMNTDRIIYKTSKSNKKLLLSKKIKLKKISSNPNLINNNSSTNITNIKKSTNNLEQNSNTFNINTLSNLNVKIESCQECLENDVSLYCRTCNCFICSNCKNQRHSSHSLMTIEDGNISLGGYKYQKLLINELQEYELLLKNLVLKDEEDSSDIINKKIEEIKKVIITLATTGQKMLDIFPEFTTNTEFDSAFFYNEKVNIYSLMDVMKKNKNFFSLGDNNNIFNLLQEHEKKIKKMKLECDDLKTKCEYKQLFVSVLEFIINYLKDLNKEINMIYKRFEKTVQNNKEVQENFLITIRNFINTRKKTFKIEIKFEDIKKNRNSIFNNYVNNGVNFSNNKLNDLSRSRNNINQININNFDYNNKYNNLDYMSKTDILPSINNKSENPLQNFYNNITNINYQPDFYNTNGQSYHSSNNSNSDVENEESDDDSESISGLSLSLQKLKREQKRKNTQSMRNKNSNGKQRKNSLLFIENKVKVINPLNLLTLKKKKKKL